MLALGVLETSLYVDDLGRAARFYEDLFERTPLHADARMRAYALGATVLLLFQRRESLRPADTAGGTIPPHDGNGPLHVAFAVEASELRQWEMRLEARSIPVESRVRWPRGGTSVYFRDPCLSPRPC